MKTRAVIALALIAACSEPCWAAQTSVIRDHLACASRDDAARFVNFYASAEYPTFEAFLHGMEASGRCVWWHKGDRVTVLGAKGSDSVTVEARRKADRQAMYFDGCYLDGSFCR